MGARIAAMTPDDVASDMPGGWRACGSVAVRHVAEGLQVSVEFDRPVIAATAGR